MLYLILCWVLHVSNTLKRYSIFVADVSVVAFVYDVAGQSDLKTELALVVSHCDEIL